MRNIYSLGIGLFVCYIVAFIAMLCGWVMNFIDVLKIFMSNQTMTTLNIGHIVGIPVFPIGAVLGWFF